LARVWEKNTEKVGEGVMDEGCFEELQFQTGHFPLKGYRSEGRMQDFQGEAKKGRGRERKEGGREYQKHETGEATGEVGQVTSLAR